MVRFIFRNFLILDFRQH